MNQKVCSLKLVDLFKKYSLLDQKSIGDKNRSKQLHKQKQKSKKFIYFLKLLAKDYIKCNVFIQMLKQSMKLLMSYVNTSDYEKLGNLYTLYAHVLKKYRLLMGQELHSFHSSEIAQRIKKSQESEYYEHIKEQQISSSEMRVWSSCKFNSFFAELNEGRVFLQSPECVCCSRVFVHGCRIKNRNPNMGVIIGLSSNKVLEKVILEKYLDSVCNQGGGVIVVGAQNRQNGVFVSGIRFQDQRDIFSMQNDIINALQSINPPCFCFVERVMVHSNFFGSQESMAQQKMRICFRIKIFPRNLRRMSFLKFTGKTSYCIYETYKLDSEFKPVKTNSGGENFYMLAHLKHRQWRQRVNNHPNIMCYKPYQNYSYQYINLVQLEQFEKLNSNKINTQSQIQSDVQQIELKYQNSSFLITNVKDFYRQVQTFRDILKSEKYNIQLKRPYTKYFNENMRCIWILNHQINFVPLRKILQMLEKGSSIKKNSITMIPVFENLEIEQQRITNDNIEYLIKKTKRYFKEPFQIRESPVNSRGQKKKMIRFHFSNKKQAILGYMILEQLGLRPYTFRLNSNPSIKV